MHRILIKRGRLFLLSFHSFNETNIEDVFFKLIIAMNFSLAKYASTLTFLNVNYYKKN